jgi:hypothetical protein
VSQIRGDENFTFLVKKTGKPDIDTGKGGAENDELWLKDNSTGQERLLVSSHEAEKVENLLAEITVPQFSVDKSKVYFMSAAYAVSDAVHAVDLRTGREAFVCPGNSLFVVPSGKYKGDLVVNQHRYHGEPNYGSYDHYFVVDGNGKELKDLGEDFKESDLK